MKKATKTTPSNSPDPIDFFDRAAACNVTILALADLLASHNVQQCSEETTVGNVGSLILNEARQLHDVLLAWKRSQGES